MRRRIFAGVMVILLLAEMFVLLVNVQPVQALDTKVVFRLLAVDGYQDSAPNSAQQLIENLTAVGYNWQNTSWAGYQYTSYIHLLTNSTVKPSLQKYRVGQTTPTNIISEMFNFLAATGAGESNKLTTRIFYYNGHSGYNSTNYYFCTTPTYNWRTLITDTQLRSNFNSRDLATSNCTLIILDTCYAAGYFNTLGKPGRVILAACQSSPHESYAWRGPNPPPGYWAAFTGNQQTLYNKTWIFPNGPVGIIGAIKVGYVASYIPAVVTDTDYDGWYSAAEVFAAANKTVVTYEWANSSIRTWGGVTHEIQRPQMNKGVVAGGIPFVMYAKQVKRWDWPFFRWKWQNVTFAYNPPPVKLIAQPIYSWLNFHNSPAHTGWTLALGPSTSLLWNTSLVNPLYSSVAIADGCAFVGTLGGGGGSGGSMYALSLPDGKVLWNFTADGPIWSSPAVANGTVVFATTTGSVYALYEDTGLLSWRYATPPGESVVSSPCLASNRVFIGSIGPSYGRLYALNGSTGMPIYNFTADSAIYSSPAVADGKVFFGTNGTWPSTMQQGRMYALDEFTGNLAWSPVLLPGPMRSSPAVADGRVCGGCCTPPMGPPTPPAMVFALNESNGQLLWGYSLPPGGDALSSPAIDSGKHLVIVGFTGGGVYALTESSGTLAWMRPTDPIGMSSPAIAANGLVYIGTNTGILHCLNETNGQPKWSYTTGGQIAASPSITDGHVLVSSMDGKVYCWGPPFPQHDVQTSKATVTPPKVLPGNTVTINYTVANVGNVNETFNVDLAYNTTLTWHPPETPEPTIFHTDTVTLRPGERVNKTYSTIFANGKYTIIVMAEPAYGEINATNNDCIAGNVYVGGPPINVTFRLLAIEGYYSLRAKTSDDFDNGVDEPMKSAQYLITTLISQRQFTTFNNWLNQTTTYDGAYNFTTHIHLLSADPSATSLPYYRGTPTNSNVVNEIQNFLAATQSPWENNSLTIRILYYCGHSAVRPVPPQYLNSSKGFFLCLGQQGSDPASGQIPTTNPTSYQELWDFQLNQTLNYGDLAKNNCTLIILDSCHSGAAITTLKRAGRAIFTASNWQQLSQGWLSAPKAGTRDHWSWFTGQDLTNSYFSNGTQTQPFGIIGALLNGTDDSNKDGWLEAGEIFSFANDTTYKYAKVENPGDPQKAQVFFGASIPIVEYCMRGPGILDFPYNGIPYPVAYHTQPQDTWSGFHRDPSRTGVTGSEGPMSDTLFWSQSGYDTNASVIVSEWEAVVATKNGVVHGLDLTTGNEIWRFTAESQIISTPAVDKEEGIIYVATLGGDGGGGGGAGGILYAIDEPTGRVRWKYQAPSGVGFYASPAVADGLVFVATTSVISTQDWVYAFNQTSGQQLWNRTLDTSVKSSPAVRDGLVYVGTTTSGSIPARLHALMETSGVKVWNASFGLSNVISSPAVAAGMVIIGCMGGGGGGSGGAGLYAYEESTGAPLWSYLTTSPVSSSPAVDEARGIVVGCSEGPGGGGGRVFALTLTGSYIWSSPPESVKMSSPAISGNKLVYVGTTNNLLLCLNETSGTIVWSYITSGSVTSSPAISADHVLVGTTGSSVYSFGPPFPDVAVTSVTPCKTRVVEGDILNVNVTVTNKGDLAQTFNVTLYFAGMYWSGRAVQTLRVMLAGKSSTTLTFGLGLGTGSYVFSAYAWPVKYEMNTLDNYCFGSGDLVAPVVLTRSLYRRITVL